MKPEDIPEKELREYAFYRLIEHEGDYIGRFAYTLYKARKIDYIIEQKSILKRKPSDDELKKFQKLQCRDDKLVEYRQLATNYSEQLFNELSAEKEIELNEKKKQLLKKEATLQAKEIEINNKEKDLDSREESIKKLSKEIYERDRICRVKGGYWRGLSQSLLASFIWLVVGVVFVLYIAHDADILNQIKQIVSL